MTGERDTGWCEATRLVHAGAGPEAAAGPQPVTVNPPVQRGSTVILPRAERMFAGDACTYGLGGRLQTHISLRTALAELEHAEDVALYPSGLAAVTGPLLALLRSGDELLMVDTVYGPTRRFAEGALRRFGVSTRFFPPRIGAGALMDLATPSTRAVFLESPGSVTFELCDTPAITAAARERGLVTLLDNTWAAGLLFKPLDHGVDVSIQALTKYVSGHADVFMGAAATRDPQMARRLQAGVDELGWNTAADDAYLALRGLRTLSTRLQAHAAAGLQVARWLQHRPEVAQVLHPGLEGSPDHALWRRDFTGANGLFGAVLRAGTTRAQGRAFLDALRVFGLGFSWGGYESLAVVYEDHVTRTAEPLHAPGPLMRLHVGLEDVDDLLADLGRGFEAMAGA